MGLPHVVFSLPGGGEVVAVPGAIVGRLTGAAVRLADLAVSEAHAMVSLRGGELRLLALRGTLRVGGELRDELVLGLDQQIELAPGVLLGVVRVEPPRRVLALSVDEGEPKPLEEGERSVGAARFVVTGDGCVVRWPGGEDEVEEGWSRELEGRRLAVVSLALGPPDVDPTWRGPAWKLVSRDDVVEVCRPGRPPVLTLTGRAASLVQVLGWAGEPMRWQDASAQVWRKEPDEGRRLSNWWKHVKALRKSCAAGDVPTAIIDSDGRGTWRINGRVASFEDRDG